MRFLHITAVAAVIGPLVVPVTVESARELVSDDSAVASVPSSYDCGSVVPITVETPNGHYFQGDRRALQKLIGGVRATLSFECASSDITKFEVQGRTDNITLFRGRATKDNGWRLETVKGPMAIVGQEIDAIENSFDGLNEMGTIRDKFVRRLTPANRKKLNNRIEEKRQDVGAALSSDMKTRISEFSGDWKEARRFLDTIDKRIERLEENGFTRRAEKLQAKAEARLTRVVENELPRFRERLNEIPTSWDGLTRISEIGDAVEGEALQDAFASHRSAVDKRKSAIVAGLKSQAVNQIKQAGSSYRDVGKVASRATKIAEKFETHGNETIADTVRNAGDQQISKILSSGVSEYRNRINDMADQRKNIEKLKEDRKVFRKRSQTYPEYREYSKLANERMKKMRAAICEKTWQRAGITGQTAERKIDTNNGPMPLGRFICALDKNGHEVTSFALKDNGDRALMKVMRDDESFRHLKMRVVEARPGQQLLVATAEGDPVRQEKMRLSEWRQYAGELLNPGPSGKPDDNGVTECDRLASHPGDPEKKAQGVGKDEIDVEAALEACVAAQEYAPKNPRINFLLGRVTYAAGDPELAKTYLKKAAQGDYAAAKGFLGELKFANAENEEETDRAKKLLKDAASQDYEPARKLVAKIKKKEEEQKRATPSEQQMKRAVAREMDKKCTRGSVIGDGGCLMRTMGWKMTDMRMKIDRFEKINCTQLGEAEARCTQKVSIACNMVHDNRGILNAACDSANTPAQQQVYVRRGDTWQVVKR